MDNDISITNEMQVIRSIRKKRVKDEANTFKHNQHVKLYESLLLKKSNHSSHVKLYNAWHRRQVDKAISGFFQDIAKKREQFGVHLLIEAIEPQGGKK